MEEPSRTGPWAALAATRPTKAGKFVLEAAVLFFFAAWVGDRADLYAGAALLGALFAVGFLGAAYAARSLEVSWDCPSRVFAEEPFPLRFAVANRGLLTITGVAIPGTVTRTAAHGPTELRVWEAVLPRVAPGCSVPLDVRTSLRRRGPHELEAPRLEVAWPFGLAASVHACPEGRRVLAYPRRVAVPGRDLRSREAAVSRQEIASAVPRGGELLRGVREWAPGDAPRAIAWRASARHGELLTREFEREEAGRAVVALDADPRDFLATERVRRDAVERACSVAASLLLRFRAEGRHAALAVFTPDPVYVPSVGSEPALGRALEAIARLEAPAGKEPHGDPLSLVPPAALRGARVLLVKAAMGPARTVRRQGGTEIVTLPALRATLEKER